MVYIILDTFYDNIISVVSNFEGETIYFDSYGEAEEFAKDNCQRYVIVELTY